MKYLSTQDVLMLHHLAIEETGGAHGVRDLGLLESAVHQPQATFDGQNLYPTLFDKVGILCSLIIKNHPFVDGNKRTGLYAAITTIELNGFRFECVQDELVEFGFKVARGEMSKEEIFAWLESHSTMRVQGGRVI